MTNPYAPSPLAGGAEALVGALLGGDRAEERARSAEYDRILGTQLKEATLDQKISEAYLDREKRRNFDAVPAAVAGGMPDVPEAIRGMLVTLAQAGMGADIERIQQGGIRARLPGMREAEGFSPANALASAYEPKPIENMKVDGNHLLTALYGNAPVATPTDYETARTAERATASSENVAQAGAAGALEWRRRAAPLSSSGGGRSGGGGGREPTLSNHPGTGAKVTREAVKMLMSDVSLYRSDFIRKYGTAAYRAVMGKRGDYRSAERRDRKAANKDG